MQLVRFTFQKGRNQSDKDIPLSIRLLGLRKVFEICRHAILVVENKILLDMSALKISFAWIHLACNTGFCFSLYCALLRTNPNPLYLSSHKTKCSWWTSDVVFPKWLPMPLLPGKTSGRRWQFPQWVFVSSLWWCAGDGMHGMAPFWQSIPRQGCGEDMVKLSPPCTNTWAGSNESVTSASRCCVCHHVTCSSEPV